MVIYWPPGSQSLYSFTFVTDLSFFPLMLDFNAIYLTVDDKIKIGISSYFHITDITVLTQCFLLVYCY